jgi:hypothetical protein
LPVGGLARLVIHGLVVSLLLFYAERVGSGATPPE